MQTGYYIPPLVVISIAVAILASYTTLSLSERVSRSSGWAARRWIAGGALAMGTGIWSMHFIGMLAFRLPIALGFDLKITALSLVLPITVSALALWQVSQPSLPLRRLISGSLLMGVGITVMHYTGMAALRMSPALRYDPLLFAASLLIAIAASAAALWVAFHLRHNTPNVWLPRVGASVLLGAAIAGMHYTGMAAAIFSPDSICIAARSGVSQDDLTLLVTAMTTSVLAIALITSELNARIDVRNSTLAVTEATARERQRLLDHERGARRNAERVNDLKDEFLAVLSHELRTPLNAIMGWTELLKKGISEPATRAKAIETIERNVRLQTQLIDDLLDMSKMLSDKMTLEREPLDPSALLEATLESIAPAAAAKNIRLQSTLQPGKALVEGDRTRLQQVLSNLMTNAVKFTPEGGTIWASVDSSGGAARIVIRDSGIGISPEFLPHVFDRFRQADASTTRRFGGLGLGLSIVQHLVKQHGGAIAADSAGEGQGSTFTVTLPLMPAPAGQEHGFTSPARRNGPLAAELRGKTVLMVDDAVDTLDLMERVLLECGAHVVKSTSATFALALAEVQPPDLIVSDIGLPDMDGLELLRQLRRRAACAAIPALAVTAFTRAEDRRQAAQAGYDDLLTKPFDGASLVLAAAALLGQGEQAGVA